MRGTTVKFLKYLYRGDIQNLQRAKNSWMSFNHIDRGKMFPNSRKFWKLSQATGKLLET